MTGVPQIEGYSALTQVAKGGFGIVYRAHQERFDRVVALKVLKVDNLDDRGTKRFERECRAMGSLSWHPNVVAVHDSGICSTGQPFLAMEFLERGSLGDRLHDGPVPWPEALVAGVQVAGALGAAHDAGVLHRDLKPENLLVGPFGEIKLGDFGIAAVDGATRTTGHASFTVAHVAPEILLGKSPDERSDLYGLASTLYHLIAGAPPFGGATDEPIGTTVTRVLHAPTPRLDGVPEAFADLLERTLAKDPDRRPSSAGELGQALQEVQAENGQAITPLLLGPVGRTAGEQAPSERPPSGSPPALRPDPHPTATVAVDAAPAVPAPPSPTDVTPSASVTVTDVEAASAVPDPVAEAAATAGGRAPTDTADPAAAPPAPPGRRRRVVVAVGATLALVVAAVALLLVVSRGDDEAQPQVTSTIDVGPRPFGLSATEESVWVTDLDGRVVLVDPVTNDATATVDVGANPVAVAATDDAVWVANADDDTVTRVDPTTQEVVATVDVGGQPAGVAADDAAVWVVNVADDSVSRIDPTTNAVVATVDVGDEPHRVAVAGEDVWVSNAKDGTVTRIDAAANEVVATVDVGANPFGLAATGASVWVANLDDATVTRIDTTTNEPIATIEVGRAPHNVVATGDAVWVTDFGDASVTRLDPVTDDVTATVEVGNYPEGAGATGETLWVANSDDGTVSRIDPPD